MKRLIGPILMGLGAVVFLIGLVMTVTGGDDGDEVAATTTTTSVESTTTTVATTTSGAPTTTAPPATTTTEAPPETTTTTIADETVEEFVEAFSAALEAGDRDFVLDRLHPEVYAGWGEDLCVAWVDREIMTLTDYTLVQINSGPLTATVTTPNGQITVPDVFEADVSFTFQGESFDSGGTYALIEATMHWLGQCR